ATWQFWVGKSSASTAMDSSYGTTLDVNGDGFADFLVGTSGTETVYLFLGNATGTGFTRIDLQVPDTHKGGSEAGGTSFGARVAVAGDVNGDGYADFLVAAPYPTSFDTPFASLYLGGPQPSAADWNGATAAKRIDLVDYGALAGFGASMTS